MSNLHFQLWITHKDSCIRRIFYALFRSSNLLTLPETEVTASKMVVGRGSDSWMGDQELSLHYYGCIMLCKWLTLWCLIPRINDLPNSVLWSIFGSMVPNDSWSVMKTGSCHGCHGVNFVISGGTGGCRDKLRCHKWGYSWALWHVLGVSGGFGKLESDILCWCIYCKMCW